MAAFRAAVAHGYGIELDIHITRDGKVVVFHDDTLERMCGEHGKVEDYTLVELQKFHLLNTTERIPELQEVLEYVDGRAPLLVELRHQAAPDPDGCTAIVSVPGGIAGRIPADGVENRISKAVLCPAQSVFTRDP